MNINRKLRNRQTACFLYVDMCATGCDSIPDTYNKIICSAPSFYGIEYINMPQCSAKGMVFWKKKKKSWLVGSASPEEAKGKALRQETVRRRVTFQEAEAHQ